MGGIAWSRLGYWRQDRQRVARDKRRMAGGKSGRKGGWRAGYQMVGGKAGCKFKTRCWSAKRGKSETQHPVVRAAGHEILRTHGHVKPSPATFCLLPSMHERLAFVFRDFSTRPSGSLDFPPTPPPSPSLLLVAPHANRVARNRRAASERGPPCGATPAASGRKRTAGRRKKEPEEEPEMYRSRTRSTATPWPPRDEDARGRRTRRKNAARNARRTKGSTVENHWWISVRRETSLLRLASPLFRRFPTNDPLSHGRSLRASPLPLAGVQRGFDGFETRPIEQPRTNGLPRAA